MLSNLHNTSQTSRLSRSLCLFRWETSAYRGFLSVMVLIFLLSLQHSPARQTATTSCVPDPAISPVPACLPLPNAPGSALKAAGVIQNTCLKERPASPWTGVGVCTTDATSRWVLDYWSLRSPRFCHSPLAMGFQMRVRVTVEWHVLYPTMWLYLKPRVKSCPQSQPCSFHCSQWQLCIQNVGPIISITRIIES